MFVIPTTRYPDMLMVVTVMVAIVVALIRRGDHAARGERRDAQKQSADCEAYCVVHGVSLGGDVSRFREAYPHALAAKMLQG
jgi:hypothetical protein